MSYIPDNWSENMDPDDALHLSNMENDLMNVDNDSGGSNTVVTTQINSMGINVKYPPFPLNACKVDGITNDTLALQAMQDSLAANGGGILYIPAGTCIATLQLDSNVTLKGAGWTTTYLKCPANAGVSNGNGVVQSRDFNASNNLWQYYAPYPDGLCMGITIEDITIDGNRVNNTMGNGLCLYGGKFILNRIGVINCAHNGIWTQMGTNANSTKGNDLEDFINMHESLFQTIFICNTNARGWYYNGPNDSFLTDVQIKSTGGAGFWVDVNGWCLKIGTLHCYATNTDTLNTDTCQVMIGVENAIIDRINCDSPQLDGVLIASNLCVINTINVLQRNVGRLGHYYAIRITGSRNTIGKITSYKGGQTISNTGTMDGGEIHLDGDSNIVESLIVNEQDTSLASSNGIVVNGNNNRVNFNIDGYKNHTASNGIYISGSKYGNILKGTISNCTTAINFDNSSTANQVGQGNEVDIKTGTVTYPLTIQSVNAPNIKSNIFRVFNGNAGTWSTQGTITQL